MPALDITNPAVIRFLSENYEKESRLRLSWINKHKNQISQAATLTRPSTGYYDTDVFAYNMGEGMFSISRDHVTAGYNRRKVPIRDATFVPGVKHLRKGHSIVDVGLGTVQDDPRLQKAETDLTPGPVMRPVAPHLKKLVHRAIPGRELYLEERSKIMPEKRYYFAECVNWDYGWRMKDSKAWTRAKYGRCALLKKSLESRVGPQPDPIYYKSGDAPGVSKCSKN